MPHKYYARNLSLGNASLLLLLVIAFLLPACSGSLSDEIQIAYDALPDKIDYNFHIKPILSDRCYNCHGPDPESRKADLRLDLEENAFGKLSSGNRAFVKGSLRKSEVMKRIMSHSPDLMMPPPESELTINNTEIALIAKWIDQGAEWKEHWSFLPIGDPEIPIIDSDWIQENPIDNFIQAELLLQGFAPSEKTAKERLIKRVTMDLTGLPPEVEEIDRFINNPSKKAYEYLVDSLLNTIAFAERMTQEWMDVSRYADSHGVSFDGYRTSWPFRDWVINAFKTNMSYNDFITHQIAGDLIEDADEESLKATAFLRMNPLEASAGSIPEEFRIEYVNERASLVGTAIMGLTLECAKCHDHKFDPITQKEFFQVSAFFNNTPEFGLAPTDSDRAPTLLLLDKAEKVSIDSFITAIDDREKDLAKIKSNKSDSYQKPLPVSDVKGHVGYYPFDEIKFYKKELKIKTKKKKKIYKEIQLLDNNKKAEANLKVTLEEGKFNKAAYFGEEYDFIELREIGEFDHTDPFSISTWIKTEKVEPGSTQTIIGNGGNVFEYHRGWELILDSLNHVSVQFIHRLPDEIIEVKTTEAISSDEWHQVAFTYDGCGRGEGISIFVDGVKKPSKIEKDKLRRSMIPIDINKLVPDTIPLMVGRSSRLWMYDLGLFQGSIDEIKIYDRQLSLWEMSQLGQIKSDNESSSLKTDHWYLYDKSLDAQRKELKGLREQLKEILDDADELMIMEELETPRKTYVLDKGLYNQPKEAVEPGGVAKVLAYGDYPKNRLGLAQWLFDPDNPIVARVAINRYWQMIFGKGIVKTSEDFGSQGTRPSHPDLLDWLAADFINSGWDVRHAIKQMVMSHTYQQSSYTTEELREKDPENNLLARSPSYRWPAEIIRDNVLMASGLLNKEVGGPSVKTYQPEGLWKEIIMASPKLKKYKQDSGDSLYRRSLYTFSRRFAPHPYMVNFDATPREICTIRRNITNTPLQALTLLNDPQIVEASRVLSEKMQKQFPDSPDQQIKVAFRKATGLTANEDQVKILSNHYLAALDQFKESPEKADSLLSVGEKEFDFTLPKVETAAMAVVVNTIFNFDESYIKR